MKRFIIIFLLSNVVLACTDVLDKYPLDQLTEKTYWTSASDLELYVNQFYPALRLTIEYPDLDQNSDNLQPLAPSSVLDGTRSIPETGGGWNWASIREVNYFLENAPKVTEGQASELNQYLGEGYFFRAYFYFDKVKRFGDVPWYDQVLNIDSEGLMAPREPRNVVIDHIIDDLDQAIALLQTKDEIGMNRVNLEATLAFKSRVALYEGTWEKYHAGTAFGGPGSDGSQYLQMAADAAQTLMDMGTLQLYSTGNPSGDYWALFNRDDLAGNPEAILVESVDPGLELGTWVWTYLNGTRGKGTGLTQQLVSSYLATDGLPISLSPLYKGDTTLQQTVINRDPRLSQTMWVPGQVQIATTPDPLVFEYPALHKGASDLSTTGYMLRKGSTTDPEQNQGSSTDRYGKIDGMVFRYAEVLLNYAEAKAELGTLTQADLDKSINLIRARVGMPPLSINVGYVDPEWNFPNLSPIINEIRRERRIELALEGFRYDDLMRWAAGDIIRGERLKGARFIQGESFPQIENQIKNILVDENRYIDRYRNGMPDGFGFNPQRDYLYPIPTNELSLNPNLTQNPGW
jgi:hypothetical protein